MRSHENFVRTILFSLIIALTGCSSAKYNILRNFKDGSKSIEEYAVVFTSASIRQDLVASIYRVNDNMVNHGYYVLEPGDYSLRIIKTRPGGPEYIAVPILGSVTTIISIPKKSIGKEAVAKVNLKAGYVYYIKDGQDSLSLSETPQNHICESEDKEIAKRFKFVKDNLRESAFKDGFGPYPLGRN